MKAMEAVKIIGALSYGRSPFIDEALAQDSVFARTEVKEALQLAHERLVSAANAEMKKPNQPPNAGSPWKPAEDELLAKEFDQSVAIDEIARLHGRTRWAITTRLEHLGKIKLPDFVLPRTA